MKFAIVVLALLAASPAAAQTFTYGNADDVKDVKKVDWTGTAEAGLLITTGNARTTTVTATGKVGRVDPKNKLEIDGGLAFARSSVLTPVDADMSGDISPGELERVTATTANSWTVMARYDRFLTALNSLYAIAQGSADPPSGKAFVGGGQLGYSRHLFKNDHHDVVAEAGYDFRYEVPVDGSGVAIHSARAFVGWKGTVKDKNALEASLEALSNLNHETTAPTDAAAFEDTRINGLASITSKITADISFSFSVALHYDHHPSALPAFSIPFAPGFAPTAGKLDTITKASLIFGLF